MGRLDLHASKFEASPADTGAGKEQEGQARRQGEGRTEAGAEGIGSEVIVLVGQGGAGRAEGAFGEV